MTEKNGNGWRTAFIGVMVALIALAGFTISSISQPHTLLMQAMQVQTSAMNAQTASIALEKARNDVQSSQILELQKQFDRIEQKLDAALNKGSGK